MVANSFIIRPSVALRLAELPDGGTTATFYYDRGTRRLKLDLSGSAAKLLSSLRVQGLSEQEASGLSGDALSLFSLLRERNILSSSSRESWLADSKAVRFDRQLRLLSELLPVEVAPRVIQDKLESARIAIVGLGGTGSNVLQGLAQMGVRNYFLLDPDVVEPSNLNRQPIYDQQSIGTDKVVVAGEWMRSFYTDTRLTSAALTIESESAAQAIREFAPDLIINCADQPSVESTTNHCLGLSTPNAPTPVLVAGGYFLMNTFAGPFIVPGRTACLTCNEASPNNRSHIPAVGGNTGFVASMGASITLSSVFAAITGAFHNPLENCQVAVDVSTLRLTTRPLKLDPSCPTCGMFQQR